MMNANSTTKTLLAYLDIVSRLKAEQVLPTPGRLSKYIYSIFVPGLDTELMAQILQMRLEEDYEIDCKIELFQGEFFIMPLYDTEIFWHIAIIYNMCKNRLEFSYYEK